ncbi:MAG TPA: family 16 glycosylhydrolase [Epulopiscium sp.]|nr:family 16 glycosylhydrolase [Candidatus Epulonipiscium sp.]
MKKVYGRKRILCALLILTMVLTNVQGSYLWANQIKDSQVFNDVKENLWYTQVINKWAQSNIIAGYEDGSFKPNNGVTRAELASIIVRIFGLTDTSGAKNYDDIEENKWYSLAVEQVSSAGIMNDEGESFNPNLLATREEVAYAIAHAYKITEGNAKEFKDQASISSWALNCVNALAASDFIVGRPNGNFGPKDKVTRAEVIAIIDRMTTQLIQAAGTYSQDIEGNLVVNIKDVILKDMIITGNLYLAEGIGMGDATLDGVTVNGQVFIEGGGVNSITINNATLSKAISIDTARPVRVLVTGKKVSIQIEEKSMVHLTGNFSDVVVSSRAQVIFKEGFLADKVMILPASSQNKDEKETVIEMAKGSRVKHMIANGPVNITGEGKIEHLEVNETGVSTQQKPDKVIAADGTNPSIGGEKKDTSVGGGKNSGHSGGGSNSGGDGKTEEPADKEPTDKEQKRWKLVWNDEFDGTEINPKNWTYNNGFLDLNEEKQVYQSENVEVSDGSLKILAKKEKTLIDGQEHDYTSARILTKGRYAQKYGKIEVRAKLPVGKSIWPAIWMLPEDDEYTGWPTSGEIDIMEGKGSIPNKVWGTLHYGDKRPDNAQSGSSYDFKEGESIDQFHTYAIEWQPGEIKWFVDGELYQTQDNWESISPTSGEKYAFPAPFDKKFHIILNVALGGWYDGLGENLEVDDTVFEGGKEHAMEVDYVRFYESADGTYQEAKDPDAKKPALPKDARVALADGNLIYDNSYQQYGIKVNKEGDLSFDEGWNLMYLSNYGAEAKASIETLNHAPFAKIEIDKGGNQNYAIQLVQHTTVGRGRAYKLSFDAKASDNRTLNFKVGGGEARGYAVYSGDNIGALTTEIQHFEKVFTMRENTDTKARLEFNLGLDTSTVWVGNVKLEEVVAEAVEEFNRPKGPLKDGNLIYNGDFDKGKLDRLTYWNLTEFNGANASMNVPEVSRDLHINIQQGGSGLSDVTLDQRGIKLTKDSNYNMTFSGKSDRQKKLKIKLLGEDGKTIYAEEEVELSSVLQAYQISLVANGNTTNKARLVFEMGGEPIKIFLDDIKIIEARQDMSGINIFPLKNGDFTQGNVFWEAIISEGGQGGSSITDQAQFTINDTGANPWSVMLVQKDMDFAAGIKYIFSFEASSTIKRDIVIKTEEEGSWIEFFKETVTLTPEKQTFTFEYTMPAGADKNLGLKFILGSMNNTPNGEHIIVIDNVVCEVKDGKFLKSEVKNGRFDEGMGSWNTYVAEGNGAVAHISADDKVLKIGIDDLGQNPWEVQVSQKGIRFQKGKIYYVGFRVKGDEDTKLKLSIGGEDDSYNFTNYLGEEKVFNVTQIEESHAFSFIMTKDTDTDAKISFDAGKLDETSVPTTLYIDDIYIIEGPDHKESEDNEDNEDVTDPKVNLLKNGDFENAEDDSWFSWVNLPAEASITTGSAVTVAIRENGAQTSDIVLAQSGIALDQGMEYVVDFEVQVTVPSSLRISILDSEGVEYTGEYSTTVNLVPGQLNYKITFIVNKDTDPNLTFRMEMGKDAYSGAYHEGTNTIILDNIVLSLKKANENLGNTIYLDNLSIIEKDSTTHTDILKNGDFSTQGAWQYGGPDVTFSFDEGNAKAIITNEGKEPWDVILFQPNIALEKGKTYTVSFEGKADAEKKIRLLASNSDYLEYFNYTHTLTQTMKEYSFEFTVSQDTSEALEFKIFMGGNIN